MSMSLASSPCRSSQTATTTAATTMNMKAGFQKASEAPAAPSRTTAEPMAALRSRPARPWSFCGAGAGGEVSVIGWRGGGSDLEQLGFLVLEQLIDRVGVRLGDRIEALLRAGDVVLAHLAVLLEALEVLLGGAAQVTDRHPAVLGLGL